jgi:hypothetical protein
MDLISNTMVMRLSQSVLFANIDNYVADKQKTARLVFEQYGPNMFSHFDYNIRDILQPMSSKAGSSSQSSKASSQRDSSSERSSTSVDSSGEPRNLCEEQKSTLHGQGMFTPKKVRRGNLIFSERPLAHFEKSQALLYSEIWNAYLALGLEKRTAWYQLTHVESEQRKNYLAREAGETSSLCGHILANFENNSFEEPIAGESFLCNQGSRFNHRCHPNAVWVFNAARGSFDVRAAEDIDVGQEVFLSYIPQTYNRATREKILADYGIDCNCSLCSDPSCAGEQKRESIFQAEAGLVALRRGSVDIHRRIKLYERMFEEQDEEPSMVLDMLIT